MGRGGCIGEAEKWGAELSILQGVAVAAPLKPPNARHGMRQPTLEVGIARQGLAAGFSDVEAGDHCRGRRGSQGGWQATGAGQVQPGSRHSWSAQAGATERWTRRRRGEATGRENATAVYRLPHRSRRRSWDCRTQSWRRWRSARLQEMGQRGTRGGRHVRGPSGR